MTPAPHPLPSPYLERRGPNERRGRRIAELIAAFNRLHGDVLKPWPTLTFTLESGNATLAAKFADVALDRRPPRTMRVTEAEALASCITSVIKPDEETTAKLVVFLREKIAAAEGVLPLRTQSGLFVARKP